MKAKNHYINIHAAGPILVGDDTNKTETVNPKIFQFPQNGQFFRGEQKPVPEKNRDLPFDGLNLHV